MSKFIITANKHKFNPFYSAILLFDVAHALENIPRFLGHTWYGGHPYHYDVASHSVLVAELMQNHVGGDPLEGLLHDAMEAYLSDIPTPWKKWLPDYCKLEDMLEYRMRGQFDLPLEKTKECSNADTLALLLEARIYQLDKGEAIWDSLTGHPMVTTAQDLLDQGYLPLKRTSGTFMTAYNALTKGNKI